jgi:hypothetical protein
MTGFSDAQTLKERREADLIVRRMGRGKYSVYLDHISEAALWLFFCGTNGRWYGTNDTDDRLIDAHSLSAAKMDLRLGYWVGGRRFGGPQ